MRFLLLLGFLFMVGSTLIAQPHNDSLRIKLRLSWKEKRMIREEEEKQIMKKYEEMFEKQSFVLLVDNATNNFSPSYFNQARKNFILVDSINGIMQFEEFTYMGEVYNYKFTKNEKHDTYNVSFSIFTQRGYIHVKMYTLENGIVVASVNGMDSGYMKCRGKLIDDFVLFKKE